MINLRGWELEPFDRGPADRAFRVRSLGPAVGAKATGCTVYELDPGHATWPYHFELNEEEWLLVVDGELTLRTPDGERVLRTGDVACFPPGPAGGHAVRNGGEVPVRFMMMSAGDAPGGGTVYPDEGKFQIYGPDFHHRGRLGDEVDYWEGV